MARTPLLKQELLWSDRRPLFVCLNSAQVGCSSPDENCVAPAYLSTDRTVSALAVSLSAESIAAFQQSHNCAKPKSHSFFFL